MPKTKTIKYKPVVQVNNELNSIFFKGNKQGDDKVIECVKQIYDYFGLKPKKVNILYNPKDLKKIKVSERISLEQIHTCMRKVWVMSLVEAHEKHHELFVQVRVKNMSEVEDTVYNINKLFNDVVEITKCGNLINRYLLFYCYIDELGEYDKLFKSVVNLIKSGIAWFVFGEEAYILRSPDHVRTKYIADWDYKMGLFNNA